MVATFHLLAPGHVASIEIACNRDCLARNIELKSLSLRMRFSQFFFASVANNTFDLASFGLG